MKTKIAKLGIEPTTTNGFLVIPSTDLTIHMTCHVSIDLQMLMLGGLGVPTKYVGRGPEAITGCSQNSTVADRQTHWISSRMDGDRHGHLDFCETVFVTAILMVIKKSALNMVKDFSIASFYF